MGVIKVDMLTTHTVDEAPLWLRAACENAPFIPMREAAPIMDMVSIHREAVDIHQLYHVFVWNYQALTSHGDLISTGDVLLGEWNTRPLEDVRIEINSLVMNCVSSGECLIETSRKAVKHWRKRGERCLDSFDDATSREYDSNVSYAFLYKLRNSAQHGQLLVSVWQDTRTTRKACFDLDQLSSSSLLDHGGRIKTVVKDLLDRLDGINARNHHFAVCLSLDTFVEAVLRLYLDFLRCHRKLVEEKSGAGMAFISHNRDKVLSMPDGGEYVVLLEDEHHAHPVFYGDSSSTVFDEWESEVEVKWKAAKEQLDSTQACYARVSDDSLGVTS